MTNLKKIEEIEHFGYQGNEALTDCVSKIAQLIENNNILAEREEEKDTKLVYVCPLHKKEICFDRECTINKKLWVLSDKPTPTEQTDDWMKLAKNLSECSDVMPTTLELHQSRIYNSCLDMVYYFEKKISKEKEKSSKEAVNQKLQELIDESPLLKVEHWTSNCIPCVDEKAISRNEGIKEYRDLIKSKIINP